MNLVVLGSPTGWHVQDLLRAAGDGYRIQALSFRSLCAAVGLSNAAVRAGQVDLTLADAVLVCTMPPGSLEQVVYRMDVLHRLTTAGVPVINPPRAIECAVDKYLSCVRLEAAGLPVPATVACETVDDAMAAFEQLGGDIVLKPVFGSEGRGMMHLTDPNLLYRACRTLERLNALLYLQEFLPHPGYDVRALVVGDRVIAGMKRFAQGDWRTNVAQGGRAERYDLTDDEQQIALRAARAVAAEVAGVDLLSDQRGTRYVLEVNSVPGWRAMSQVVDMDLAEEVLSHCRKIAAQTKPG